MNPSNFWHTVCAVIAQIALALLTGNWWLGAAFGIGVFLGREHAQVQIRQSLGVVQAFDFRKWPEDSLWDLVWPAVACLSIAYVVTR